MRSNATLDLSCPAGMPKTQLPRSAQTPLPSFAELMRRIENAAKNQTARNPEFTVLDPVGTSGRGVGNEEPLPHDVGHSNDSHPTHRFQRRECGTQKPGAHCMGHWRTRRLVTRSRTPSQTTSSESHRSRRHRGRAKHLKAVVYPSASMEAKVEIPESREAWIDHRLHTDRAR